MKLRKQSDMVKLIGIFALVAAACLVSVVCHAWEIYSYVNTPAEYVLAGEVSQKRLEELRQNEEVAMVSQQMEIPVSISYQGVKAEISATVLSKEYIEGMYGAGAAAGTRRIYMNEAAFSELRLALSEKHVDMGQAGRSDGSEEYDIRYFMAEVPENPEGDDAVAAPGYKMAKLIVRGTEERAHAVFTVGTDRWLRKRAGSLRVRFTKHDLDGLHVEWIGKLGYTIENEAVVVAEEYEVKQKLLHIQYGLLCGAVCLVAGVVLKSSMNCARGEYMIK